MNRLKNKEAAQYLGVSFWTLNSWRSHGKGPAWVKVGGQVRYEIAALEAFIVAGKTSKSSN